MCAPIEESAKSLEKQKQPEVASEASDVES